jgi:hypothetical protein
MTMTGWATRLGMLLVIAGTAGTALAQRGPGGGAGGERPSAPLPSGGFRGPGAGNQPPPGMSSTSRPATVLAGEYQEMNRIVTFTAVQQKSVGRIQENEEKALADYDKENAKKLEDLNKKLADLSKLKGDANSARNAIQTQITLVGSLRDRRSHSFKVQAMGIFTPAQKATWVSTRLNQVMTTEFMPVSLSEEQQAKVKAICDEQGKTATNPDVMTNQALQDTIRQQVMVGILDQDQRTRYQQVLLDRQQAKNPG